MVFLFRLPLLQRGLTHFLRWVRLWFLIVMMKRFLTRSTNQQIFLVVVNGHGREDELDDYDDFSKQFYDLPRNLDALKAINDFNLQGRRK